MFPEALTDEGGELFPRLAEFNDFYLAGGTGLALQIGHRVSEGFDFFTSDYLPQEFLQRIEETFPERTITPSVTTSEEVTVLVDGVKLSFIRYPFPLQEEPAEYEDVEIMVAGEIAATKAYTIGRRGQYKDYVDLYFVLREEQTTLPELLKIAAAKYGEQFNTRLFLEQLVYLDDLEEVPLQFIGPAVSKGELLTFFERETRRIDL